MKRSLARWLLAVLALGLAFGCAPSRTEEPGLRLWFPVDPNLDRTSSALDACPYDGEQTVPALLSALLAGPPAEEGDLVRFIPEGTRVLSWSLEDGVANVELSAAYAGLVGMELTLADCCITLTLAQLPEVDGVRVTVNGGGQSYRDRRALYPGDMLFSGAEEAQVEVPAALYFRREGGDTLGYELRVLRLTEGSVPAKAVLSALIAGPEDEGLVPLLPEGLSVHSVRVDEGLCTADLSKQLLELPEEERALAARSIVETLRSLDAVEEVRLLIEGEPYQSAPPP
ncbi:MAG: GerMN domain-containing protein [Oscillospiraceae bacterium]|nr:GerMN domain-containing protein [Oscillospiraceae bacterium]MCI9308330.1 GerMN domain-containing protein [Oscillospiraceae bacterium]